MTQTKVTTNAIDDQLRAIVRDAIESQNSSVYRVARESGLHDEQLRGWLCGRRTMIRSDLLGKVLDGLGVQLQVSA